MLTVVYIFTNDQDSERVKKLESLFRSDLFKVKILNSKPNTEDLKDPKNTSDTIEKVDEVNKFYYALRDCDTNYPHANTFILKDSSVTHINSHDLEDIFKKLPDIDRFHLCYFCKWLDRCDLYTNKKELGKTSIIAKTQAPHGIQALLITKECRDILLGKVQLKNKSYFEIKKDSSLSNTLTEHILKGHLTATCVVPNIFDFDLTRATKINDYYKTFECLPPPSVGISEKDQATNKFASYAVMIFLLLLIIVGIYLLVIKR